MLLLQVLSALPPVPQLRSEADCRAYLQSLPGGAACLERTNEIARCIEASHPIDQVLTSPFVTLNIIAVLQFNGALNEWLMLLLGMMKLQCVRAPIFQAN